MEASKDILPGRQTLIKFDGQNNKFVLTQKVRDKENPKSELLLSWCRYGTSKMPSTFTDKVRQSIARSLTQMQVRQMMFGADGTLRTRVMLIIHSIRTSPR